MIKRATVILLLLLMLLSCKKDEPVNVKPKVKRERVEQSYFREHKRVEASELPELSLLIFGLPGEVNFPDTEERVLFFSELFYEKLYILNIAEEIKKINLTATDPAGKVYSKLLRTLNKDFSLEEESHSDGTKFKFPAVSISITPVKEPNPFDYESRETFKSGETIYIFGNNEEPDSQVTVALYRITDRLNEDREAILEAFVGTKVTTDSKGKYSLELVVGDDMPKGRYKMAHGKVIDGVNGFEANVRIE